MSAGDAPRAVLDSCVLFSASLRDLLMSLAVNGLFEARWTDKIYEQWMENFVSQSAPNGGVIHG